MKKTSNKSYKQIITITFSLILLVVILSTTAVSYSYFAKNTKKYSNDIIQETTNQITYNYENYIKRVLDVSEDIQENIQRDNSTNYINTLRLIDNIVLIENEILSIEIYKLSGAILLTDSHTTGDSNAINQSWFKEALANQTIHFLSLISNEKDDYRVNFTKTITTSSEINTKAILKIQIDFKEIIELNYKTNLGENGHTIIIDDKYNLIYSSNDTMKEEELNLLKNNVIGISNFKDGTNYYTVSINTISNSKWRVAVFYDINQVNSTIQHFIYILLGVEILILILGSLLIVFVSTQITDPIKKLEQNMAKANFKEKVDKIKIDKGPKEVISLANSYNAMVDHISSLMQQIILEQNNQRKAELKALQYQINPHFLYNTLDSIVYMIEDNQKEDAQNMIIALAKLFRISISRGNNIIPVRNEIEHVKNYLYIQSMRYKDAFSYEINIDEECYNYKVMKLILQPIVENSIYHGLKTKVENGHIKITGYMKDKNLVIEIYDDGYGISPEGIKALYEKFDNPDLNDGVGLKNVYQRLRLYYGNEAYLKIESELDEFTNIIISIPVEEL